MRNKIQEIVVQAVAGTKDLTTAIDDLLRLHKPTSGKEHLCDCVIPKPEDPYEKIGQYTCIDCKGIIQDNISDECNCDGVQDLIAETGICRNCRKQVTY